MRCLVVGAGQVAQRKIMTLVNEGANVIVVSPLLTPELEGLLGKQAFTWVKDYYHADYLEGSFLVIAATNDRAVNARIASDCRARQLLVNVIDSREESSFTVNSMHRQGDLMIAVSTNGISPAMAKSIRKDIGLQYGEEYKSVLEIIREARSLAQEHIHDEEKRRACLLQLGSMDLIDMLKVKSIDEVKKRVKLCLSYYWD